MEASTLCGAAEAFSVKQKAEEAVVAPRVAPMWTLSMVKRYHQKSHYPASLLIKLGGSSTIALCLVILNRAEIHPSACPLNVALIKVEALKIGTKAKANTSITDRNRTDLLPEHNGPNKLY